MNRRQLLSGMLKLGSCGGLALPLAFTPAAAQDSLGFNLLTGSRRLNLYRPETKESLKLEYLRDGQWVGDSYYQICWFLRDWQADEYALMDTELIAILDWTQWFLAQHGYTTPLHILSGFRTEATNKKITGSADNSQHLAGKAIDLHMPGLSPEYLASLFRWLRRGGVGVYPNKGSVHIDTGPLRSW